MRLAAQAAVADAWTSCCFALCLPQAQHGRAWHSTAQDHRQHHLPPAPHALHTAWRVASTAPHRMHSTTCTALTARAPGTPHGRWGPWPQCCHRWPGSPGTGSSCLQAMGMRQRGERACLPLVSVKVMEPAAVQTQRERVPAQPLATLPLHSPPSGKRGCWPAK